ncbi:MAG: 3D domain-containing protein [Patescibacteria group bacterium]
MRSWLRVAFVLVVDFTAGVVLLSQIIAMVAGNWPTSQEEQGVTEPNRQIIPMTITAYCPCTDCCGSWAELGPDREVKLGRKASDPGGAATDPSVLSYGTILLVPGAGTRIVDDTGGAMRQSTSDGEYHIDLRFPTHKEARAWGVKRLQVSIISTPRI